MFDSGPMLVLGSRFVLLEGSDCLVCLDDDRVDGHRWTLRLGLELGDRLRLLRLLQNARTRLDVVPAGLVPRTVLRSAHPHQDFPTEAACPTPLDVIASSSDILFRAVS